MVLGLCWLLLEDVDGGVHCGTAGDGGVEER